MFHKIIKFVQNNLEILVLSLWNTRDPPSNLGTEIRLFLLLSALKKKSGLTYLKIE